MSSSFSGAIQSKPNPFAYYLNLQVGDDSVPLPPLPSHPNESVLGNIETIELLAKAHPPFSTAYPGAQIKIKKAECEQMLREGQCLREGETIPLQLFKKYKDQIKTLCFTKKLRSILHDRERYVDLMKKLGRLPKDAELSVEVHRSVYIMQVAEMYKQFEVGRTLLNSSVKKKVKEVKQAHKQDSSASDEALGPKISKAEEAGLRDAVAKIALKHACAVCSRPGALVKSDQVAKAVLKKCARCEKVYYCSVECQRKDWARHKIECRKPKG